jgi:DNA-binding XRE family transcriptional regulator
MQNYIKNTFNLLDFFRAPADRYSIGGYNHTFDNFLLKMKKPMSKPAQKIKPESGNSLRSFRESLLMSKAELARKARISPITISRIEDGYPCRMDTKRKIILALGLNLSEKHKIFSD